MVDRLIFVVVMVFTTGFCFGQTETVLLWGDNIPGVSNLQQEAVISDNNSGNVIRLSQVTKPLLKVYLPDQSACNGKAMVICPGGGYSILAIDLEGYEVAEWLRALGYHVFVLQYRVPGNRMGAFQDVQRAIRMVRASSGDYGYGAWKVGVMGFSAGGHLSARAASGFSEISYEPVDQIDENSCRPDFAVLIYPAYLDDAPDRDLSLDINMDRDIPPIFIFGTADDPYGNSALVLAQAMRDNKHQLEFHFLASGGHGYGLRKGNPAAETWPGLLTKWLLQFD
ncbi:MAG: alpha/beta hydrolase [Bacteroidales bacterium]|nr:alpha/beta hydrolase [Bacteroidales bacterium]